VERDLSRIWPTGKVRRVCTRIYLSFWGLADSKRLSFRPCAALSNDISLDVILLIPFQHNLQEMAPFARPMSSSTNSTSRRLAAIYLVMSDSGSHTSALLKRLPADERVARVSQTTGCNLPGI
jgi:hypothetical protein